MQQNFSFRNFSILHYRWQYFYKSQVLKGFSPSSSDNYPTTAADDDAPQHPEEFLAILTAYGQAIVTGNDPQLTRNVLHSLQSLNERFRLYSRSFFRTNLLKSFQCALIKSLISPEGSLHFDYILSVLFPMGQVSDAYFHESFVSLGYSTTSSMVYEICVAKVIVTTKRIFYYFFLFFLVSEHNSFVLLLVAGLANVFAENGSTDTRHPLQSAGFVTIEMMVVV